MPTRRQTLTTLGLAGAGLAGLAACSNKPSFNDGAKKTPPKASALISTPESDATNVPAGVEIVFSSKEAVDTKFELTDANGAPVTGAMHPEGGGWIPAKMLTYGAVYTATVSATGDDNKTAVATHKFTVMGKPTNEVRFTTFSPDNKDIGTGMPLIFQLNRDIPKDARAGVQRRMMVKIEPFVEGVWAWYTPRELHWRPKEFWKPGTKIFVDARVGGVPCGDGFFGVRNVTLTCTAAPRQLIMTVDDAVAPKAMVVTKDGQEVLRIPVSLGKPEWQSSSGVMVIIEKKDKTIFDTRNDPNAREKYVAEVEWAQRTTWGGEHIHSAPWSVQHQGIRNVSHGCINMSAVNAKALYDLTMVGDPVITVNTGAEVKYGDGWTHWSKSFEEYAKGSAIPYAPPAPAPSATPTP